MLRRILDLFGTPKPKTRRFVPSSPDLPELWPTSGTDSRLDVLDAATTETLAQLCDDYWNSYLLTDAYNSIVRDSRIHRRALDIIASRGTEGLLWARQRLTHDGYDAREDCAWLITQLAKKDQLGAEEDAVARELATLAVTPPKDDTKEAQAAVAALGALSVIGGPVCMDAVRQVLTSIDWDDNDNQWECADILAEITNEPFMDAEDPAEAAKAWLAANPGNES